MKLVFYEGLDTLDGRTHRCSRRLWVRCFLSTSGVTFQL